MAAPSPTLPGPFLDVSIELLGCGRCMRFRAQGLSMHPAIRDGEAVTVEPTGTREIKVGDIVFCRAPFHPGARALVHRVMEISEEAGGRLTFRLRGDNAERLDPPVGEEQILGRVVLVERNGRPRPPGPRPGFAARALRAGARRVRSWLQ